MSACTRSAHDPVHAASIVLAHGPNHTRCPWHGSACEHGCNKKVQAESNLLNPHLFHAARSSSGDHTTHNTFDEPRTKGTHRTACRGFLVCCRGGHHTDPIDRRCSCSPPWLRCRPLPPAPPACPHGRRTCWTREVLRRGMEPPLPCSGSARRARGCARIHANTVAAAASPLPPSIPPLCRGRTCAHTHLCLFLGFRI